MMTNKTSTPPAPQDFIKLLAALRRAVAAPR